MSKPVPRVTSAPSTSLDRALGPEDVAKMLGITVGTIQALRSREPDRLPPPFMLRPLRWRAETVQQWREQKERAEADRIAELLRRRSPATHYVKKATARG